MIKMEPEILIKKILEKIETEPCSIRELQKFFPVISLNLLKDLERTGFIYRENPLQLISSCKWKLSKEGRSFLKFKEKLAKESQKQYEIVMTLPPIFSEKIIKDHPEIKLTEKAMREILSEAKEEIRILSPYVDASAIDYLNKIKNNVKIRFLTVPSKYGKNAILERLKQTKPNLEVKYLFESRDNVQQFQIHAKIIISDKKKIYIGSANFRDTSILYNLEGGIILTNHEFIKEYISIFEDIYNSV